jgi:L-threonylcarbamoyladenylate synthase
LVAFPTETVYGLGGNAFDDQAIEKLFLAKGRPSDNPIIVHIATINDLRRVATNIPDVCEALMNRFWPGPLTLVLSKRPEISSLVSAGLNTVAVRMPDHKVALTLLHACGLPIAAPSANSSGRPSPTRAEHVLDDLTSDYVAAVLDGGATREGVESTVLDLSGRTPTILRPGSITKEMLLPFLPNLQSDTEFNPGDITPRSPGQKYIHYAPKAPLYLYAGDRLAVRERLETDADMWRRTNRKVAVLLSEPIYDETLADLLIDLSAAELGQSETEFAAKRLRSYHHEAELQEAYEKQRLQNIAQNLYSALRLCDSERVGIILVQGVRPRGLGEAIMNRLQRAAREVIYMEEE